MLVISRKVNQSVQVGDSTITVMKVAGNKVRLAIDAPKSVPIVRDDAKKQEPPK